MTGQGETGLRDQMREVLDGACSHLQDDAECADFLADKLAAAVQARLDEQTAEIERLSEERDAARLVSKGRTVEEHELREALQRVRDEQLAFLDGQIAGLENLRPLTGQTLRRTFNAITNALDAALDQAPAEEANQT